MDDLLHSSHRLDDPVHVPEINPDDFEVRVSDHLRNRFSSENEQIQQPHVVASLQELRQQGGSDVAGPAYDQGSFGTVELQ